MKKYLASTKVQFIEFMQIPTDQPLQMLNLLKFKKQVEGTDLTGEQQYDIYMKAAMPFIKNQCKDPLLWKSNTYFDWPKRRKRMG